VNGYPALGQLSVRAGRAVIVSERAEELDVCPQARDHGGGHDRAATRVLGQPIALRKATAGRIRRDRDELDPLHVADHPDSRHRRAGRLIDRNVSGPVS